MADYNDERAWVHLLMLPQAGRKRRRPAAAFTLERLQRWHDGERASLWATRPQPPRQTRPNLSEEQRQQLSTLPSGVQQGDPLGPLLFSAGVQPLAAGLRSQPIDFSVFYLDDGVLGGPLAAVNAALAHVQRNADGSSRILTDFEFSGAAIGRPARLQPHAAARVDGARKLLEAVGGLPDPQVALRLLRASAGYARLVHTMRCCPPAGHAAALETFDGLIL